MSPLQAITLLVAAVCGTVTVLIRAPLRQTLMLAIYGFALTALFFVFQAPDVALSQIVVSGLALPLFILSTLRKLSEQERARSRADGEDQDDAQPRAGDS